MPKEGIFEFAAQTMLKYDKKWKVRKFKDLQEKLKERELEKERRREEERERKEAQEELKRIKGRHIAVPLLLTIENRGRKRSRGVCQASEESSTTSHM